MDFVVLFLALLGSKGLVLGFCYAIFIRKGGLFFF